MNDIAMPYILVNFVIRQKQDKNVINLFAAIFKNRNIITLNIKCKLIKIAAAINSTLFHGSIYTATWFLRAAV